MPHNCIDCKKEISIDAVKEINGNRYCSECYFEQLIAYMKTPKTQVVPTITDMKIHLIDRLYMERIQIENKIKELNDELLRLERQSDSLLGKSDYEITELYSKM